MIPLLTQAHGARGSAWLSVRRTGGGIDMRFQTQDPVRYCSRWSSHRDQGDTCDPALRALRASPTGSPLPMPAARSSRRRFKSSWRKRNGGSEPAQLPVGQVTA